MSLYDGSYYNDLGLNLSVSLKNARIGYENLTTSLTASSSQANFPATSLENPFTYDFWKPGTFPADIVCTLGSLTTVDYVGIGAHELSGCMVTVSTSTDGTNFDIVAEARIKDDTDIMILFEPVQASSVKITLSNWAIEPTFFSDFENQDYSQAFYDDIFIGTPTEASCSVIYVGLALAMERMIYGGHSPGTLNRRSKFVSNTSEGGQWLGRSKVRTSFATSYNFTNLTASWYRQNFDDFADVAETQPFFISWRPMGYANEVLYAQTPEPISPENQGLRDFMSVSFNVEAYRGT